MRIDDGVVRRLALLLVLVAVPVAARDAGQGRGAGVPAQADATVPADLRPLLTPAPSAARMVVAWYEQDRALLHQYWAGAGGGGGGRGGGRGAAPPAAVTAPPFSVNRIARLKRHDLDWQVALGRLDASRLSAAARTDLDALKATVARNLQQLEADTRAVAEVAPFVPFGAAIVELFDARQAVRPMDARRAAGTIDRIEKDLAAVRARVEQGLLPSPGPNALRVSTERALRGAATTDALRATLANWFGFYNGYDPLFTWWMGLPYPRLDRALGEYAAILRDRVAPAGAAVTDPAIAPQPVAPSAAPAHGAVPDLATLIALPHDEMTGVVQRFTAGQGRGGAATGGRAFYEGWLAALKTLDFDRLSRNAQVDYLFIRQTSEAALARMDFRPPADIPRKADQSGIPGPARGRDGLILDLTAEMIPYTPEQLIALANREFARQEAEMIRASRELGFGDDWKRALAHVKDQHEPPGGQPVVIRAMLDEAVDYLRANDLITVPQVAAETFRMSMMSPERQLVNPFFTGGAQITLSYPTNTMDYDARLQSMRGNATALSHATAHHEMIPGHNLTAYAQSRYGSMYRAPVGGGNSPFVREGWAVYWETILFDRGFHDTPEERIGALFWLMHRSARIIFSFNFHMGVWSPQECIDFLVDKVGHERDNAIAEVRRSFDPAAGYSPLYQAAYLLGALQLRGLRAEIVDSRQMTEREFHDEIVRQGPMPIGYLRLALTRQRLTPTMDVKWAFYGPL